MPARHGSKPKVSFEAPKSGGGTGVRTAYKVLAESFYKENAGKGRTEDETPTASIPLFQKLKADNGKEESRNSTWMESIKDLNFNYRGDLFNTRGSYNDSVIYMSRLPQKHRKFTMYSRHNRRQSSVLRLHESKSSVVNATEKRLKVRKTERKRQCAAAIESVAANPAMTSSLLQDNVLPSIFTLCRTDDLPTVISCTAALCYLSMDASGSGKEVLVRNGTVVVIQKLLKAFKDEGVILNCLAIISNLSIEDGFESTLVKEKSLELLITHHEMSAVAQFHCVKTIFNLTCPLYSYARIEDVIDAIFLVSSTISDESQVLVSKALYNLTSNRLNEKRVEEHDVLSVLNEYLHSSSSEVRMNATKSLLHISESSSGLKPLTKGGSVEVLVAALSINVNSEEEKRQVLATLHNLSSFKGACIRMGKANLLEIFCSMSMNSTGASCLIESMFGVAAKIIVFPENGDFVSKDFVKLSIVSSSVAGSRNVLFCLVRLTSDISGTAARDVIEPTESQQRLKLALLASEFVQPLIKHATLLSFTIDGPEDYLQAKLMYNLSFLLPKKEAFRPFFNRIQRSSRDNTRLDLKQLAAVSLLQICTNESEIQVELMDSGNLLPVLEAFLQCESNLTISICLELICVIFDSKALSSYVPIVQKVFPILVKLCVCSDVAVRSRSAACFTRFSTVSECRVEMVENGLIASLALLAGDDDPNTLLLCVSTYSHLSCDAEICKQLIENGIVKSLTALSAAPEEIVRRACATAFCNLSFLEENSQSLVERGTLPALLVISCVKSNDEETRRLCMKAVINLMRNEDNLPQMCKEGLAWAFAVFAENITPEDSHLVALAFCGLANSPISRSGVCRPSILNAFFNMLTSEYCSNTKKVVLQGLLNLLEVSNREHASRILLKCDVLPIFHTLVSQFLDIQDDDVLLAHIAEILCVLHETSFSSQPQVFAKSDIILTLSLLIKNPAASDSTKYFCGLAAHHMSLETESAEPLILRHGILENIFREINPSNSTELVSLLMRVLYNVSCAYDHLKYVCEMGIVQSIMYITKSRADQLESIKMCAAILRNLTAQPECLAVLVTDGAITVATQLFASKDRGCKEDSAMAICNITLGNVNSSKVLSDGALAPILWLTTHSSNEYTSVASAALRKMATPRGNLETLVHHKELIPRVGSLLEVTSSNYIRENCLATLCLLSSKEEARTLLSSYGIIALTIEFLNREGISNLDPLVVQILSDLLSNLASHVHPDMKTEQSIGSALMQLTLADDEVTHEVNWLADREYLCRKESGPLTPPTISEERKLRGEKCPRSIPKSYPVVYDGFSAGFDLNTDAVNPIELKRQEPDSSILNTKPENHNNVAGMLQKTVSLNRKSSRWKKLASVEFSTSKMYSKITDTTPPVASLIHSRSSSGDHNISDSGAAKESSFGALAPLPEKKK